MGTIGSNNSDNKIKFLNYINQNFILWKPHLLSTETYYLDKRDDQDFIAGYILF